MNSRNLGRFKIQVASIEDHPEKVAALFAMLKIVPVRAEIMFDDSTISYLAISDRFDEVPQGGIAPWYEFIMNGDGQGWPQGVIVKRVGDCAN